MKRREFMGLAGASVLTSALPAQSRERGAIQWPYRLATGCPVADPFCARRQDGWYLVGTQHARGVEDRRFSMFFSPDLLAWQDRGPVLELPQYEGSNRANYWAPEFVENAGSFYLYYTADSFGDPERRFVRVARAQSVTGPYLDSGERLVDQPSIDGHPHFLTPQEGRLFYCGNEGNPHVGQLLVDRFLSPSELAKKPRKVFPDETVEWEEGAFVIGQADAYYLFSSMGNWRDGSYHVRVARSNTIDGPWQRLQQDGAPYKLLQTVEGQWGPGHNSIFRGPDGRWWVCYHAWDRERTGRYPWVAPIVWDGRGYPVVQQ
jgi:beta-xylosidase